MKYLALLFAVSLSAIAVNSSAGHASTLVGDSISASYDFPTATTPVGSPTVVFTPSTFVVGSGVESLLQIQSLANPSIYDSIQVDFAASSLTFTFLNAETRSAGTFNGPEFTVTSGTPFGAITGVMASQAVTASLVGGVLEVNWQGQTFAANDKVVVNLANAVPEPATWAMMVLGFVGVGFMAYRRKQTGAAFSAA